MVSSLIRPNEVGGAVKAADYEFTGFSDVFKAAYENQKANFNFISQFNLKQEQHESAISSYRKKWEELNPDKSFWVDGGFYSGIPLWKQHENADQQILQWRNEGVDGAGEIPTSEEASIGAVEKAKKAELELNEALMMAHPDSWDDTGAFLGGMAGWFADPYQAGAVIATAPISGMYAAGGTVGTYFLRMAAMEGLVGMGIETASQVSVYDWQQQIGNDYDISDAAAAVGIAGVAGFGLTYLLSKGLHKIGLVDIPESVKDYTAAKEKSKIPVNPRENDGDILASAEADLEKVYKAMANGEQLRDVEFSPRSSKRAFVDDAVTYDHGVVARGFVDTNRKSGFNDYIKNSFLEQISREIADDVQLNRVDLDAANSRLAQIEKEMRSVADVWRERAKQWYELGNQKPKNPSEANAINGQMARRNDDVRLAAKRISTLSKERAALKDAINNTKIAKNAESMLDDVNAGVIPEQLSERYKVYKKNVNKAHKEILNNEAARREFADRIIAGEFSSDVIGNLERRVAEARTRVSESLERFNNSDTEKAALTEFKGMVEANPDEVILIDKVEMSYKQIQDDYDSLRKVVDAISKCRIG